MNTTRDKKKDGNLKLRCPECRTKLSRRRTRNPDECEMICGGCGQMFDVCDLETIDNIRKQS